MKYVKQAVATIALAASTALVLPAAPALADGAASTRNIFFGAAAATYLVIQHNRKVHEKYAEDARRAAALQSENSNAWAAYHQEQRAYAAQVAVNSDLKREVAYQHRVIEQGHLQLSMLSIRDNFIAARAPARSAPRGVARTKNATQVAMQSYGWGQL